MACHFLKGVFAKGGATGYSNRESVKKKASKFQFLWFDHFFFNSQQKWKTLFKY